MTNADQFNVDKLYFVPRVAIKSLTTSAVCDFLRQLSSDSLKHMKVRRNPSIYVFNFTFVEWIVNLKHLIFEDVWCQSKLN